MHMTAVVNDPRHLFGKDEHVFISGDRKLEAGDTKGAQLVE
jgi:hypothetical protein